MFERRFSHHDNNKYNVLKNIVSDLILKKMVIIIQIKE